MLKKTTFIITLLTALAAFILPARAETTTLTLPARAEVTTFTYRSPESPTDRRYEYDTAVLMLALEKTKAKWGPYKLVASKVMNYSRAQQQLYHEELENPMFKLSATDEFCEDLGFVPFPIDLGIVGYRLFFVSNERNRQLASVESLADLKRFTIGQGFGWLDVDILKAAGFQVVMIPTYESLFSMVADGRFDLFPRGANEVKMEYEAHTDIPDLEVNHDVGIYYPLPRFFYTNKSSTKAAKRVYEGLVMAYEDGSLLKLWEREYGPSLEFGQIDNVRFFEINNPFIRTLDPAYKRFIRKY